MYSIPVWRGPAGGGGGGPTAWSAVTDKPATFPPDTHTHAWASVTDKPATFPPDAHTHTWASVTGKPATFPPDAHTHTWASVTGKPTTFSPAAHTHATADITGLQAAVEGWAVRTSDGVSRIVPITQAAYDALGTKVATTLYLITG